MIGLPVRAPEISRAITLSPSGNSSRTSPLISSYVRPGSWYDLLLGFVSSRALPAASHTSAVSRPFSLNMRTSSMLPSKIGGNLPASLSRTATVSSATSPARNLDPPSVGTPRRQAAACSPAIWRMLNALMLSNWRPPAISSLSCAADPICAFTPSRISSS
jgi:hypothetical protein